MKTRVFRWHRPGLQQKLWREHVFSRHRCIWFRYQNITMNVTHSGCSIKVPIYFSLIGPIKSGRKGSIGRPSPLTKLFVWRLMCPTSHHRKLDTSLSWGRIICCHISLLYVLLMASKFPGISSQRSLLTFTFLKMQCRTTIWKFLKNIFGPLHYNALLLHYNFSLIKKVKMIGSFSSLSNLSPFWNQSGEQ